MRPAFYNNILKKHGFSVLISSNHKKQFQPIKFCTIMQLKYDKYLQMKISEKKAMVEILYLYINT